MIGRNFSLQLINAETQEPLKESVAPDGKVYVEAEPDLEYFIRCKEYALKPTIVILYVDGKCLGYKSEFVSKTRDLGLFSRKNGISTRRALKLTLKRTRRANTGGSSSSDSNAMMLQVGLIEAFFYKAGGPGEIVEKSDSDKTDCLNLHHHQPSTEFGAKKAFRSVPGSTTISSRSRRRQRKSIRGRLLEKVTIYYTCALCISQLCAYVPMVLPAQAPASVSSSSSAARSNSSQDDNDDDGSDDPELITEPPARKRVKTEPTPCEVSSKSNGLMRGGGGGNNLIDLTGDDD